jgi:hypothetical protein
VTQPSDELSELIFAGLDHGIDSVRDGGPLVPFVIAERGGERSLQRFMAGTPEQFELEGSVDQAAAFVRDAIKEPDARFVLVYDAYLRLENDRFDAIYAEGVESGVLAGVIAQRYRPKGRLRGFDTIGNPAALPVSMGRLAP